MRIVLDTNVLVSSLISSSGPPRRLALGWQEREFTLISFLTQHAELADVLARERLRRLIHQEEAAVLLHELEATAEVLADLPEVDLSQDPKDNFVLGMAIAGKADLLVTGDKRDLLALERVGETPIVTARDAVTRLEDRRRERLIEQERKPSDEEHER